MSLEGTFRRRNLPHWDVDGSAVFITACLDGSISASGVSRIRHYREELDARQRPDTTSPTEWEETKQKRMFAFVDKLLDRESPVRHLEDERQAEIVQDAFLYFAGERYLLLAFVVMPSHHHWLFVPDEDGHFKPLWRRVIAGWKPVPRRREWPHEEVQGSIRRPRNHGWQERLHGMGLLRLAKDLGTRHVVGAVTALRLLCLW